MLPDMEPTRTSWAVDGPVTSPFAHPRGMAGRFAAAVMRRFNRRASREVAAALPLRPGQTVLEVGFGPGVLLCALAARPERPALIGVEPSEVMRRSRVPGADLRAGTAARTGLPDASVDHVVSVNTVAIWPDLDAGLDELRRVVRPGGTVALAWHGGHARSQASRRLVLAPALLDRIEDGLRARFTGVARRDLSDVVLLTGHR